MSTAHSGFPACGISADGDSSDPPSLQTTKLKSRRGRKSTLPPEQREHARRIKKQNMERRRRACISDKMTALHHLAMNLIGEDPSHHQKTDKTDILNMCCAVFENVVNILKDQPEIRLRVQEINDKIRGKLSPLSDNERKRETASSCLSRDCIRSPSCHSASSSENFSSQPSPNWKSQPSHPSPAHGPPLADPICITSQHITAPILDSGIYPSNSSLDCGSVRSLPAFENVFAQSGCSIRMPMKYRMSSSKNSAHFGPRCRSAELCNSRAPLCNTHMHNSTTDVWRPYLD